MPKNRAPRTIDISGGGSGGATVFSGGGGGGGGVTDHGALTGLGDDDHTQYYDQTRGDARYVRQVRSIATTAPLRINAGASADLSDDRTLSLTLSSTGGLETSSNELRVKLDSSPYLNRGAGGMSLAAHPIISLHSHSGGSALDVVGLSGASTLAMLTPSSDVGTSPAAAILKSTGAGGLTLASLNTKGSIDVTNGGDLTVGANVFFVDVSQGNVGINRAPDPQFDLDVAGALRAQYLVGKQALEVKDVLLLCQYDGWEPFQTNFYGQPDGHRGQPATITAHNFRQGKFGKALACSPAMTNLVLNPSFTASTTGWTFVETGTGGSIARGSPIAQEDWLTSEGVGQWAGILTASNNGSASVTAVNLVSLPNGQTVTLSLMVRATSIAAGSAVIRDSTNGVDRASINLTTLTGGWQRVSTSWTNSTGGAVQISVRLYNTATSGTILFTNVQLEQTAFYTPYNDGDMPAGTWSGTQYASASTRVAVTASYQTDGNINQGGGAVMAWIRCVPTGGSQFVLRAIGTSAGEINLFVNSSGYLYGQWGTSSVTSTAVVADGTWHFVTITKGGSQVILYADGVQVATGTGTGFSGLPTLMSVGNNLAGRIDVLCTVNRVLPAKEILAIYNSDAPVFAVSSVFSFRISESGLVWGDAEGLWVRDRSGNAVMGVYGALAGGKSWGGASLDTGDILFGRGAQYMLWDTSAAKLTISGEMQVGTGIKDSSLDGWNISATDSEIVGQDGGVDQVVMGIDGKIKFAAGAGSLDANGLKIQSTSYVWNNEKGIKWLNASNATRAQIIGWGSGDDGGMRWGTESHSSDYASSGLSVDTAVSGLGARSFTSLYSETSGSKPEMTFSVQQNHTGVSSWLFMRPMEQVSANTTYGGITLGSGSGGGDGEITLEINPSGGGESTIHLIADDIRLKTPHVTLGNTSTDNIGRMKPSGTITVANNGTTVLNAAVRCMIFIFVSDGGIGIFGCNGGSSTFEISDPSSQFSNTAATASMTNIYVTGGNITLENKKGGSRTYEVIIIGGTAL